MNDSAACRPAPLELVPGRPTPRLYDHVVEILRARHYSPRKIEGQLTKAQRQMLKEMGVT